MFLYVFPLFITFKVTFDSMKMVNLLMNVGAQCTREAYEMATKYGARNIAKRIGSKLGIPEQQVLPNKQTVALPKEADRNLNAAQSRFNYDVSADSQV